MTTLQVRMRSAEPYLRNFLLRPPNLRHCTEHELLADLTKHLIQSVAASGGICFLNSQLNSATRFGSCIVN